MTARREADTINKDLYYWRGQVWGRRADLVRDRTLWISILTGILLVAFSDRLPFADLRIKEVASAALAYAAISFGACITSLVLVVSLAPVDRVRTWSASSPTGSRFSHYSNLVFVITWSAIAQLAVIGLAIGSLIFGGGILVIPEDPWTSHLILLWLCLAAASYAFAQLFTVVATLSQIAVVTIHEARAAESPSLKPD